MFSESMEPASLVIIGRACGGFGMITCTPPEQSSTATQSWGSVGYHLKTGNGVGLIT